MWVSGPLLLLVVAAGVPIDERGEFSLDELLAAAAPVVVRGAYEAEGVGADLGTIAGLLSLSGEPLSFDKASGPNFLFWPSLLGRGYVFEALCASPRMRCAASGHESVVGSMSDFVLAAREATVVGRVHWSRVHLAAKGFLQDASFSGDAELVMGSKGWAAHPDYDVRDLLHVQVAGSTRLLVAEPHNIFPHSHPRHRQTISVDQEAFEAILEPGDVAFIPAFWVKSLTALEPSAALTFPSSSKAWNASMALEYDFPLPLEEEWTDLHKARVLARYLEALLHALTDYQISSFGRRMLDDRFRPLSVAAALAQEVKFASGSCSLAPELDLELERKIVDRASEAAKRFGGLRLSIKLLVLQNYVETSVNFLFGYQAIYPFIKHCLAQQGAGVDDGDSINECHDRMKK